MAPPPGPYSGTSTLALVLTPFIHRSLELPLSPLALFMEPLSSSTSRQKPNLIKKLRRRLIIESNERSPRISNKLDRKQVLFPLINPTTAAVERKSVA
ncbi:hypothetical protein JHK85_026484 [Glycine max]|nr:hypothetical protein JHK85_026484 [Glycine max]